MGLLDGLAPPPGAPGAVRLGAACWRGTADWLLEVADHLRSRSAALGSTWSGPAHHMFEAVTGPLLASLDEAAGLLRDLAARLEEHADAIEHAQDEYHQCMLAVGLTAAAGVLLTPVTLGGSDVVAGAAVGTEVAVAVGIAATATRLLLAALSEVVAQAVALAGRWALLFGASVAADAASGMVVHRDLDPLAHLHLEQDAQVALVGGLAVPFGAGLAAGLRGAAGTSTEGLTGRLVTGGVSVAYADALVRVALGQHVDPGELAFAALPLGPVGHGARPPLRDVPLGFGSVQEFQAFGTHLTTGLHDAGYRDVVPVFQGSSVTGVKYTTGALFDAGRVSDFDIALASPTLFERARQLGVQIRGHGTRTAPLKDEELLRALGLDDLVAQLSRRAGGRPVNFMIYKNLEATLSRSPSIEVK
ncbi:MAG TPA: hypothetical protein VE781_03285 [Kineosporiaceae bacterium]|nr:hypothetical protein [Kineosporiaceae bacterium]